MNMIPFTDGVDAALDTANSLGAKITDMKVSDVAPGVVDLHVTLHKVRAMPVENIRLNFEVTSTPIPPIPCQPQNPESK